MPDALGPRALGAACLGVAVFEYPCSVRALRRRSGQTAQEDNRLGAAGAPPRQALVARTGDRDRGRFGLCKPPAPGKLPALLAQAGDVHYSLEVRRSTLRSCPTRQGRADRKTAS